MPTSHVRSARDNHHPVIRKLLLKMRLQRRILIPVDIHRRPEQYRVTRTNRFRQRRRTLHTRIRKHLGEVETASAKDDECGPYAYLVPYACNERRGRDSLQQFSKG